MNQDLLIYAMWVNTIMFHHFVVNVANVAPAKGNRPLSVFRVKHSEELAYPGIFLGEKDQTMTKG